MMKLNWSHKDDDTLTANYKGVKLEVNYMRNHWAWIIMDADDFPLAGSFLNGKFVATKHDAQAIASRYTALYLEDKTKYLLDLEDKTKQTFEVKLEVNGLQAILISMILYDAIEVGVQVGEEIVDDKQTLADVTNISKSIIDQWGAFCDKHEILNK